MSGRDFKNFVASARSTDEDALAKKILLGQSGMKYKPVDYEKLYQITQKKKVNANKELNKLSEFKKKKIENKDRNLLTKHQQVWLEYYRYLDNERKRIQIETEIAWSDISKDRAFAYYSKETKRLMSESIKSVQEFKDDYISPIYTLNSNVKRCIEKLSHPSKKLDRTDLLDSLRKDIIRAKLHFKQASESLQHQQEMIESELKISSTPLEATNIIDGKYTSLDTGIPDEAAAMDWPNKKLKSAMLQEFLNLDNQYKEGLNRLKEQHQHVLKSKFGGWPEETHTQFLMLREQYPATMQHRRKLMIDRFKRQLPALSILEIDKHERWWIEYNGYQERRTELLHSWSRSRHELLIKSKALLADAWLENESIKAKEMATKQQEQLCQELHGKVAVWREQKLELLKLEEEMAEKFRIQQEAKLAAEAEQEQKKRLAIKDKVTAYKKQLDLKRKEEEEAAEIRLAELKSILAEQAIKDKARIEYRKEEHERKLEDRRLAKEEAIRQEIEKEARLDKLRQKVEVHVKDDPLRVLQPTQAYNAKAVYQTDQEAQSQNAMFSVYGYTDDKILSDPRYKVENALRTAGLLKSDYARLVLSTVTPPQPPRPDQDTTMFYPSFNSM